MFSRKKKAPPAKERTRAKPGNDFVLGIPGFDQNQEDDADLEAELFALTGAKAKISEEDFATGDDDEDLEAELARLVGGASKKSGKVAAPSASGPGSSLNEVRNTIDMLGSDDEEADDIDENDPDLLGELQMLTAASAEVEEGEDTVEDDTGTVEAEEISQLDLVKSRLTMYKTAEAKAKASNETSRARRFNRGLKTLEKLLKRVQAGEAVPYDEIPPEIATNLKPAPPPAEHVTAPPKAGPIVPPVQEIEDSSCDSEPKSNESSTKIAPAPEVIEFDDGNAVPTDTPTESEPVPAAIEESPEEISVPPILIILRSRRDEYKKLALTSKKSGDMASALESVRMVKACDKLIESCQAGNVINQEQIPPSPHAPKLPQKTTEPVQQRSNPANPGIPYIVGEIFLTPKTVMEALTQRLNYYGKATKKAATMGQRSEARKLGDIVRLYQNAIRLHQRGSAVSFEKLPTPPGCPPIPLAFTI